VTRVHEHVDVNAMASSVWAMVGAPADICEWHPGIVSSQLKDGVRHCTLRDGEEIAEAIVEHSDNLRFYVYAVAGDRFGMVNYTSRIQVDDVAGVARVVWTGEFDACDPGQADALAETISATYREGLHALRAALLGREDERDDVTSVQVSPPTKGR
jgi:hypothetical protein